MRQATLCFLLRGEEILLALKKRGFGQGKWNGVGGKPNPGESIKNAAIRETNEEIGVTPKILRKVAKLDFTFPDKPEWDQQVIVYLCSKWAGEPAESEEMIPQWVNKNEILFDKMWPDDKFWLPLVLVGKKLNCQFVLNSDQKLLSQKIHEVKSLGNKIL